MIPWLKMRTAASILFYRRRCEIVIQYKDQGISSCYKSRWGKLLNLFDDENWKFRPWPSLAPITIGL